MLTAKPLQSPSLYAPPNYPGTLYDPGQQQGPQRSIDLSLRLGTGSVVKQQSAEKTLGFVRTLEPIVQSTSVLGIRYKDGVAIAADTLASYGSLARYRDVRRLRPIGQYTVIGGSGEYSDFQYVLDLLEELETHEHSLDDGARLHPKEIYNYLTRVMYNRRSRMDPLWNQLVVAGYRDGRAFLGQVDLHGTAFEDDTIATGYGAYIARPLLRQAYRPDLSFEQAKRILEDCLRVLYYRDARASNRIQIASVSPQGLIISEPYELETDWEFGRHVHGH
jgi:20S proteasome subunit beta 7